MKERWKDIPGWVGRYQISDHGNVRKLAALQRMVSKNGNPARRKMPACVVARSLLNSGYYAVWFSWLGRREVFTVHRLVAEAFVPGRHENVNHKDGDKTNNYYTNLEWLSYSDNHKHAGRMGLNATAVPVIGYPVGGKSPRLRAPSQAEAAFLLTGDRRRGSEISRCLRGERSYALGHVWEAA